MNSAQKLARVGMCNVDLHLMDAAHLEFRRDYFDYAISSYALCLLPDRPAALREWARVTRPGGIVGFTALARTALRRSPIFCASGSRLGVPDDIADASGFRWIDDETACARLLTDAGLEPLTVETRQFGYHLVDVARLATDAGIWLDTATVVALGRRSGSASRPC